ncbi:MAG: DMT family transporter, partial [Rhodospirillaceae bacterium]|nr:DMT family transporter [Rhodospirillaceae bacterium]
MPDWIGQSVQNNPFKGILLMNLAMFLLAGMDGITKTLAADYAVPQILSIRFLIFCLFALAVARPKSFRQAFRSKHPYLQITRSLIIVIEVGVFIIAFRHLPLADAHAIAGIAPLLVTALAVPFLGERVGARRWGAIAIGFLGLLVIVRPGIGIFDPTALIPLAGASLWAIYQILMRKVSDDSAATSLLYMAVTGA